MNKKIYFRISNRDSLIGKSRANETRDKGSSPFLCALREIEPVKGIERIIVILS